MGDLSIEKIRNMLGSHNDAVYMLNERSNIGEIVDYLLSEHKKLQTSLEKVRLISGEAMDYGSASDEIQKIWGLTFDALKEYSNE